MNGTKHRLIFLSDYTFINCMKAVRVYAMRFIKQFKIDLAAIQILRTFKNITVLGLLAVITAKQYYLFF